MYQAISHSVLGVGVVQRSEGLPPSEDPSGALGEVDEEGESATSDGDAGAADLLLDEWERDIDAVAPPDEIDAELAAEETSGVGGSVSEVDSESDDELGSGVELELDRDKDKYVSTVEWELRGRAMLKLI